MAVTINGTTGIETNTDTGKLKVGTDDDLQIYHDGTNSQIQNSTGQIRTQSDWRWDDSKKVLFGYDDDLQIYHDGSHSRIVDSGTGNLMLQSDRLVITDAGNSENQLVCQSDGAVELYHNGLKKFETLAGGAKVNSSAAATAEFGIQATSGQNAELWLLSDAGNQYGDKVRLLQDDGVLSTQFNTAADTWENAIKCIANDTVELYHNGTKKAETWNYGIHVLGDNPHISLKTSDGTIRGYVYADNSDYVGFLDHSGNWVFKTQRDFETELHQSTFISNSDNVYDVGNSSKRWDDIYATNGTIQTSDRNEKNTIVDSDLGLSFINKLKPVSYKFNNKTRTHYGLIAQDVETTLDGKDFAGFIKSDIPEEKYQDKEPLPEGKAIGDVKKEAFTRYGLRYAEFISPLVKAVQELSAEVETLKTKVAALEAA